MTRVEFTQLTWSVDRVTEILETAREVVVHNGNKRGVCDEIRCVTDSLDVVYEYPVKRGRHDTTNMGTCFYFTYWHPETRTYRKCAVIHLNSAYATTATTTFAHEVAHALTNGCHGYTWRRMFALLLPLTWGRLTPERVTSGRLWVDVHYDVTTAVRRYGVRINSGWVNAPELVSGEEHLLRSEKIEREVDAHVKASKRYFKIFGE